jgi:hypothetical protein
MEVFLEANTIKPIELKERCINCNLMAIAHSSKSNMIKKEKKLRGKKLAQAIKTFDNTYFK